jgi:hypothetical protein
VQVFQFVTTNMERFYVRRLLSFAHRHPGTYRIAKRFLCPGWESVDMNNIKKSNVENKYFVVSTQNSNLTYIVNSEIGICSCPVGINGAPCKHQGAVLAKFHITTLNFLPSLTSNDRMLYAYIAFGKQVKKKHFNFEFLINYIFSLGYTAKDSSFYASLHTKFVQQDQDQQDQVVSQTEMEISNSNIIEDRLVKVFFIQLYFCKTKLKILFTL